MKKIRVKFSETDVATCSVASQIKFPDWTNPLYVLVFDDGRRMLASAVREIEFDSKFLQDVGLEGAQTMINPCGADLISEAGLDPSNFDTKHEGGLFPAELCEEATLDQAAPAGRIQ